VDDRRLRILGGGEGDQLLRLRRLALAGAEIGVRAEQVHVLRGQGQAVQEDPLGRGGPAAVLFGSGQPVHQVGVGPVAGQGRPGRLAGQQAGADEARQLAAAEDVGAERAAFEGGHDQRHQHAGQRAEQAQGGVAGPTRKLSGTSPKANAGRHGSNPGRPRTGHVARDPHDPRTGLPRPA
jgi:hypothetical protein